MHTSFIDTLKKTSAVADQLQRKLAIFAIIGLTACAVLAWMLYSAESSVTWNVVKCGLVMLPALVMCLLWKILNQLVEAPDTVEELINDDDGLMQSLHSFKMDKPVGIVGVIKSVRDVSQVEEIGEVIEAIGGISLLANPLFLFVVFVSLAILLLLILIMPFVLIF